MRKLNDFYELEDLSKTLYTKFLNRTGKLERFTCTSLSIAVITNEYQQFTSVDQLSDAVARLKKECKKICGSCYLINDKATYLIH
ncbi:GGDEF domain-containing protein OS=Lysinibacillus sphaericus OX=1421 GN=LS41612_21625 PE=4 SV=1 [Lysinibacillus sphaericus]